MGLIRYYLRVFFRSHFKPVHVKTAKTWELNSSMLYFLSSCMVFGVAVKMFMKSNEQGTLGDARVFDPHEYMLKFGTKKEFTVLDVSGGKIETHVMPLEEIERKAARVDAK